MDGRRKKQQPVEKKQKTNNPQTKIKELKKDIETLESEVNLLLEHVHVASIDSLCIVCKKPITTEYHDLSCPHVICEPCGNDLLKKHRAVHCPVCLQEQHLFHMRSTHSSSSSEDG